MEDAALADEIIARLNKLIEDPNVRRDVGRLIETRVGCSKVTLDHPTIQAEEFDPEKHTVRVKPGAQGAPPGFFGFLGLLNGMVGTIASGERAGWGFITAEFDDDMHLVKFHRTKE